MKWTLAFLLLLLGLAPAAMAAQVRIPLYDSIGLNIGINCQWQPKCMREQQRAMKRALEFVNKRRPPAWQVHLCNRNASRGRNRVDWVGFDNCIRNAALLAPQRSARRRFRA